MGLVQMLDDNDVHRLAAMAFALRPDWPLRSCTTFIGENLTGRAFRDVAVALAYIATEPNTATPKRVLEAGPWWRATQAQGNTMRPPHRDEACATCGRAGDSHADDHEFVPMSQATRDRAPGQVRVAREALAEARVSLCPCGVLRVLSADHKPGAPEKPVGLSVAEIEAARAEVIA